MKGSTEANIGLESLQQGRGTPDTMAMSLNDLADLLQRRGHDSVSLFFPQVRFHSVNTSDLDACMDWFAELTMTVGIDDDDVADVVVGSLDFVVIRLDTDDPIAVCLDQFSGDHEMLAGLFDGNRLAAHVEEQFESWSAPGAVLVPNVAFVVEPLRSHRLGAWLLAETIYRMLPSGTVLAWPYPVGDTDNPPIDALDDAITRLSHHFRQCGLERIESAPWALGMSTAFTHLDNARTELDEAVRDLSVTIPLAALRAASTPPTAER